MRLFMSPGCSEIPGGQRHRLGYFVAGSLVLHCLVAGLWRGEPPEGPEGNSTFKITLLARHGDTGSASDAVIESAVKTGMSLAAGSSPVGKNPLPGAESQHLESRAKTRSVATLQPVNRIKARTGQGGGHSKSGLQDPRGDTRDTEGAREADKVIRLAQIPHAASSGSQTHGAHELSSEARYRRVRAALHHALLPVFEYPRVARRRGWEGRVKVGLFVEASGELSHIHLVESSGYSLLDTEAVKNVTSLRNVPAVTQWLDSSGMEIVLPVSYRLDNP